MIMIQTKKKLTWEEEQLIEELLRLNPPEEDESIQDMIKRAEQRSKLHIKNERQELAILKSLKTKIV